MADPFSLLVENARARFGQEVAVTDPDDIAPWLTDWRGRWTGAAAAILQPRSTDEVATLVALARDSGVALVPQGGNSSMVGGATPPADGSALILSLRRLNRIRSVGAGEAVAEAGVILQHLHEAADATGQRFPLTLGSRGSATLGGLASTNAGGTQVLRFGTMGQLITGLEGVLPDGTRIDTLNGLKKDNRGPRLDRLLIGAEGTLGVITAMRVALSPAIGARAVAWLGLASPQAALDVLRALQARTDRVEGFEILPAESLGAVLAQVPGTRSPLESRHAWHALVELTVDDPAEDPNELLSGFLSPMLSNGLVADATLAANEAQAEAFWRLRDSLSESEKKQFGPATQHDISVPVDAMPGFLEQAARTIEAAFPGTHASGFGHLGDGNIHFHVRAGSRGDAGWIAREGAAVTRMVDDLLVTAGGSISAEHGIGQMKRDELARLYPERSAQLRALKKAFDPSALFNPGKLIPDK